MQDWNITEDRKKLQWAENAGNDDDGPNNKAGKRRTKMHTLVTTDRSEQVSK